MPCDPVNDSSSASKPRRNADKAPRASPRPNGSKTNGRTSNHSTGGLTLRDIAKKLGISHVAVSLALRDAPGVSETLRRQIQAVAEEMGYRPNLDAAALGRRRATAPSQQTVAHIAWIDCNPEARQLHPNKELALCREGARNAAEQYGYVLEKFADTTKWSLELLTNTLKARDIAGILLSFPRALPKYWERFPWQDYPVVSLSGPTARSAFPSVASDHFNNCLLAFEKIRALGYPRVGFVTNRATDTRFTAGFLTAQLNLPAPQRIPIHFLTSQTNTIIEQQRLDQWIRKHRPDALLTNLSLLPQILKGACYRVPRDLGLASLDVLESDGLAGIDPKPEAIGNAAAEMLILQLNARGLNIPESSREMLIIGEWKTGISLPPRPSPINARPA
jgi:LacI family transcriptional regulator